MYSRSFRGETLTCRDLISVISARDDPSLMAVNGLRRKATSLSLGDVFFDDETTLGLF